MDADEAPDVQVLFEARRSLLAQLHFFSLLTEAAEVAEALAIGRFEVLCRLYLAVNAPKIGLRKRFNRFFCLETGLQGCEMLLLLLFLFELSRWNLLLD